MWKPDPNKEMPSKETRGKYVLVHKFGLVLMCCFSLASCHFYLQDKFLAICITFFIKKQLHEPEQFYQQPTETKCHSKMAQYWIRSRHRAFRETKTLTTTRRKTRRSATSLLGGLHHLNNLKVDSRVSWPWWMLPTSATLRCLSRPICIRVQLLL